MNTKEMIAVMQAYEDGKQIEGKLWHDPDWYNVEKPLWDWDSFVYRIKPTKKPVDLSVLIDSGIDCEFSIFSNLFGKIDKLEDINHFEKAKYASDEKLWHQCRPRLNHIHAWQGGECPLPEGFMVKVWFRDGQDDVMEATKWGVHWRGDKDGDDIIAFEVVGLADGYCYPWQTDECDNG